MQRPHIKKNDDSLNSSIIRVSLVFIFVRIWNWILLLQLFSSAIAVAIRASIWKSWRRSSLFQILTGLSFQV